MKIIIAGAGEVGFHLAKLLSYESHEITLIDQDKDRLVFADTRLDIRTIEDDATSISALKEANIQNTDLLIAVTSSETTNITISVISKRLGAKRADTKKALVQQRLFLSKVFCWLVSQSVIGIANP